VQLPEEGMFQQLARLLHPSRFGEKYYAMMFGCYLDESFDMKQSGFYVVGGLIVRGVAFFELERNWEALLRKYKIAYFKASECESGKGQFAKHVADPKNITAKERSRLSSISQDFCRLIGNPVEYDDRAFFALFGTAVVQKDFYELTKKPKAKAVLGDSPYRLTYDLAMIHAAWSMKQLEKDTRRRDCVSYICDEDEEHVDIAPAAYFALRRKNRSAGKYMCSYSMADEKQCAPLQAADAVVYEVRKVLKYKFRDWETKLREQFQIFADRRVVFYVGHSNRKQLKWIAANHNPGDPFKLDELMKLQIRRNIDKLRR
jgi:Protein of unknown function (DUF3800)